MSLLGVPTLVGDDQTITELHPPASTDQTNEQPSVKRKTRRSDGNIQTSGGKRHSGTLKKSEVAVASGGVPKNQKNAKKNRAREESGSGLRFHTNLFRKELNK